MKSMSKWFYLVIALFLFSAFLSAQSKRENSRQNEFAPPSHASQAVVQDVSADQWTNLGPNGLITNCMVVDPLNSNRIIAGSISGLFITTNGGTNWSIVNSSFYNMNVYALAMHPTDHNIILATIDNTQSKVSSIYRSADNGATWQSVQALNGLNNGKIVFSKSNPNVVYAEGYYLYKSTDAGSTWTENQSLSDINSFDCYQGSENKLFLQLYDKRFYRSDNGGSSFFQLATPANRFSDIAIHPSNATTIYAGSNERHSTGGYGFFTSTDGGSSWNSTKTGFGDISKILFITFHPDNSSIIYVGGSGSSLLKSANSGTSFTDIMPNVSDNYVYGVTFDTQRNIYAYTGGNIYKSANESTWLTITSSLSNQDVFQIAFDHANLKTFYVCTVAGVYKTTDGGANWVEKNNGIVDTDIWILHVSPWDNNTLYAGSFGGIIYKTTDGGNNWVEKSTGTLRYGGSDIYGIYFHPQNQNTLYALEDGNDIYVSTNSGDSWTKFLVNSASIKSLSISKSSTNIWYAYSQSGGNVFRSTDYGVTWATQSATSSLYTIVTDSQNPAILYANQWVSPNYNFVRSTDSGVSWNTLKNDFYVRGIYSLPISPYTLYATTWYGQGVMKSTDQGAIWYGMNTGLTHFSCFQVRNLPGYANYLFVTTYGGGLYGYNYTPTGIEKEDQLIPSGFSLQPNYPNPFNPSTTLSFSIPQREFVVLRVFDLLGREISTLVNETLEAGNYKIKFEAGNFASGVYIVNLNGGKTSISRKINLLK